MSPEIRRLRKNIDRLVNGETRIAKTHSHCVAAEPSTNTPSKSALPLISPNNNILVPGSVNISQTPSASCRNPGCNVTFNDMTAFRQHIRDCNSRSAPRELGPRMQPIVRNRRNKFSQPQETPCMPRDGISSAALRCRNEGCDAWFYNLAMFRNHIAICNSNVFNAPKD